MHFFRCSRGFTLIELLVTISIIGVITSTAFLNYTNFGTKSLLRTRIAELGEYIRYAQDLSGSAEVFSSENGLDPNRGFQVVRVKVRDGLLETFRLEKKPGLFEEFSNFEDAGEVDLPDSEFVTLEPSERYYVDVCFIDTDETQPYVRESLTLNSDEECPSSSAMLCGSPDPTAGGYDADTVAQNNFDIHFSIEQPTREAHANVIPVDVSGSAEVYVYDGTAPNYSVQKRISDVYEGVRIIFITELGDRRSLDIYRTGLISFNAADVACGESAAPDSPLIPVVVVNGVCGEIPGTCSSGDPGTSSIVSETHYHWICTGKNNGITSNCEKVKPACSGGTLDWVINGNTCEGPVLATYAGLPYTTVNTVASHTGSATFACNSNGVWDENSPSGATCDPVVVASCPGGSALEWDVGGNTCSGTTQLTTADLTYIVTNTNWSLLMVRQLLPAVVTVPGMKIILPVRGVML